MFAHSDIVELLTAPDPAELFARADAVRRECVGDEVYLRGLVEASNHCRRRCAYCGVHAGRIIPRYRMEKGEILDCARQALAFGHGTMVIQAGEDPGLCRDWVVDVVGTIKEQTGLAVTLSLGERDKGDFEAWREAGADRYLLRFETSDPELFNRIHPPLPGQGLDNRLRCLEELRRLDFEVGSGVMVGIPGQTWSTLARDIALFRELDIDMIGIGPYLPHPDTDLCLCPERFPPAPEGEQATADEETTCRVVALARLVQPRANIPATTALAIINQRDGRSHGLARGANIIMPNLTPAKYRVLYEIYPAKASVIETAEATHDKIRRQLAALGRRLGAGRGDSPNWRNRRNAHG